MEENAASEIHAHINNKGYRYVNNSRKHIPREKKAESCMWIVAENTYPEKKVVESGMWMAVENTYPEKKIVELGM